MQRALERDEEAIAVWPAGDMGCPQEATAAALGAAVARPVMTVRGRRTMDQHRRVVCFRHLSLLRVLTCEDHCPSKDEDAGTQRLDIEIRKGRYDDRHGRKNGYVGDRAIPETEMVADLTAMTLNRPPLADSSLGRAASRRPGRDTFGCTDDGATPTLR
ncbi:hypothetical protein [Nonomuraea sp. NPDC050691]|uniref:hypothetical protein n=1 Tax=Nonomuraea sp. NPDC050691 TaxID=3155661 RepID=UPI0034026456